MTAKETELLIESLDLRISAQMIGITFLGLCAVLPMHYADTHPVASGVVLAGLILGILITSGFMVYNIGRVQGLRERQIRHLIRNLKEDQADLRIHLTEMNRIIDEHQRTP